MIEIVSKYRAWRASRLDSPLQKRDFAWSEAEMLTDLATAKGSNTTFDFEGLARAHRLSETTWQVLGLPMFSSANPHRFATGWGDRAPVSRRPGQGRSIPNRYATQIEALFSFIECGKSLKINVEVSVTGRSAYEAEKLVTSSRIYAFVIAGHKAGMRVQFMTMFCAELLAYAPVYFERFGVVPVKQIESELTSLTDSDFSDLVWNAVKQRPRGVELLLPSEATQKTLLPMII